MARKNQKVKNALKNEIIGLIFLAIGLYCTYSVVFPKPGKIGMFLKFIIGFMFGGGSILFTLFLTIIAFSFFKKSKGFNWNRKTIAFIILIINICILQHLFNVENTVTSPFDIEVIFLSWGNAISGTGGGIVGLFLSSLLVTLFSKTGTLIIIVISFIIAFILFTQKSFKHFMEGLSNSITSWKNKIIYRIKNSIKNGKNKEKPVVNVQDSTKINDKIQQLDGKIKILDYTKEETLTHTDNCDEKKNEDGKKIRKDHEETDIQSITSYTLNYKHSEYKFPSLDILNMPIEEKGGNDRRQILNNARVLEKTLSDFGVKVKVVQVNMGPTITRYELQPSPGVKVSKIVNLADDIALNLAASGVRIEAPIPGKSVIGIEVPNQNISTVFIRGLLESDTFKKFPSNLAFAVGKDITGQALISDLGQMPHLLIAGATGSGKSVCINSLITSIIYKATPEQVRLILIDPKVVELNVYNGIPHLLIPVVTDAKKAAGALNWAVQEMTERYKKFAECGVRDLKRYNEVHKSDADKIMPQILVIIDELADLMMASPHEVEDSICRLAQMARAAGIHLVVATQRPSVDVITGVIKANIPSRIAFAVSSQMDSRTILDMGGAEKLLGKGDMLFYPVGESKPLRVQGAFITDKEVEKVVNAVKNQNEATYNDKILDEIKSQSKKELPMEGDELLPKAIELAIENQQISISMLQRRLRIGYARAARIIDEMENKNIIGGYEGSKPRKVLITKEELENSNTI